MRRKLFLNVIRAVLSSSIYVLQDEVTALKAENARMQESLHELSSVKDDNARMQKRIDELSSVKEDNETNEGSNCIVDATSRSSQNNRI